MKSIISRGALVTALAAATLSLAVAGSARAETNLVMSSWLPPLHPVVTKVMTPWAKDVAKVTEGRVTVRVLSKPLGPPPAHFDMAADGVADVTYGLHSFTKDDRFLRSRIGQFSFIGDNATGASKAYWEVYSGQLEAQKEHAGVKLLAGALTGSAAGALASLDLSCCDALEATPQRSSSSSGSAAAAQRQRSSSAAAAQQQHSTARVC